MTNELSIFKLHFFWGMRFKLWAEGNKLRAEGDKLWAEGDKLRAEGNKLRAEGDKLWAEGVLSVLGNVTIEYKKYDSILELYTECLLDGKITIGMVQESTCTVEIDNAIALLKKSGKLVDGKILNV